VKKLTICQILVPIDFSELSIRAITTAKNLAQRFESTVHLINIQQPFYPAMFAGAGAPVPVSSIETAEELRKSAAQRLQALAKEHRLTGVCEAVIGAPLFNEICMMARQIPADLIVTSTHGRTGLKHVFLGSTAERLVQHSPCPVFVVRYSKTKSRMRAINIVLVPVDFSDCSLEGLKYAIAFAETCAARIVVLHVLNFDYAYTADGFAMYDMSELTNAVEEHAELEMSKFVRRAKFGRIKFSTVIRTGMPFDEICTFAKDEDVDLIITSTHGRTGFKHVLIGSIAEQVVRHAVCPVLVVPSHPLERAKHLISRATRTRQLPQPRPLRTAMKRAPRETDRFTKRFKKVASHAFPERRQANKFRESHLSSR
jgi:nucleotide-binding universal stress UspA family protein